MVASLLVGLFASVPVVSVAVAEPPAMRAPAVESQSYVVVSNVPAPRLERGEFTASFWEEVRESRVRREVASAASASVGSTSPIAEPGEVRLPMASGTYTLPDGFEASRPGRSHWG